MHRVLNLCPQRHSVLDDVFFILIYLRASSPTGLGIQPAKPLTHLCANLVGMALPPSLVRAPIFNCHSRFLHEATFCSNCLALVSARWESESANLTDWAVMAHVMSYRDCRRNRRGASTYPTRYTCQSPRASDYPTRPGECFPV